MLLNCVIIEDEKHAIELLQEHIESMPYLRLLKVYSQSLTALTEISANDNIDIIFMDIEMPGISGIELAKSLRDKTRFLIFTTAYHQYAAEAFELEASQYIIKPVTFAKFAMVIDKLAKNLFKTEKEATVENNHEEDIFLKTGMKNKVIRINPADIVYLQSHDNYVCVHTDKEMIVAYLTLKEAERSFNRNGHLIQVHRSFVISKSKIQMIVGNTVKMSVGKDVPVGNAFKHVFFDYIKKQTISSGRK